MKIKKNDNETVTIDFDNSEKEVLNHVDEYMLHSWVETITSSLDETFRLLELTYSAQMALARKVKEKEKMKDAEITDDIVNAVYGRLSV